MRKYLKDLRNKYAVTQKELAKGVGISQNYYSAIETGVRHNAIDLPLLVRIANYFDEPITKLIEEELNSINKGA